MDVPAAELLLADVVAHRVLDDRGPGDEELGDVAHHHREVAEDGLGSADADDTPEKQVDHRHGGELLRVEGAAEMRRQERSSRAGHARPAWLDRIAAFQRTALALLPL